MRSESAAKNIAWRSKCKQVASVKLVFDGKQQLTDVHLTSTRARRIGGGLGTEASAPNRTSALDRFPVAQLQRKNPALAHVIVGLAFSCWETLKFYFDES
jgi:hypothetical protein